MTDRLALPLRYRKQLKALLDEHVPGVEVWAYGSRVNGESHEGSDLDLALRGPALEPLDGGFYDLLEAIEKSNIPILVQAHDWAMLPESFHREIERDYVVVQQGAEPKQAGEWCRVVVGDVIDLQLSSVDKKSKASEQAVQLCNYMDVYTNNFIYADMDFMTATATEREIARCSLAAGDVVITKDSEKHDDIGVPALVREDVPDLICGYHLAILRPRLSEIGGAYLFYALSTDEAQRQFHSYANGITRFGLRKADIGLVEIPLPPLPEQRAIAHVLGTLDDKIALNRRMNETLEEMAQALYKSWFVDFEPVRAKMEGRWRRGESLPGLPADLYGLFPDRLVDSELGEVPEGWEVKGLGEVALQRRSGVKPEGIDAESPYIALEHMPKRCIALTQWSNADGLASGKFKFEQGDILFGKLRPYFHKVGVAPLDGVCSTDIVVVQPKSNLWFGFVLGHTSSAEFVDYTDATSTGTRMPRTNWADMARYKVALPSIEVSKAFTRLVEPCVNRIVSAIHESHSLAAQRDALLPKLASGEIRVEDANEPLHAVKE